MRCPNCKETVDLVDARFCASCGQELSGGAEDPFIGKLVAGRYRVVSLVAEGGMGRVYAAEQAMGGATRKVAIKVLLSQYSVRKADVARFMRECSLVAELEHPNTIKFYDYGQTEEGDLYIVMEFVRGRSLARELLIHGTLSAERVDLIVGQICGSLQEAHDKGIIHRDLKPDNIILTDAAGQGDFVKVLDFGIAKKMDGRDPKLTPLGVVLGSPPYMSPEQFTLQDVDARSDVYSLGVMTYQALTGQMPFEAQEMLHWATLHMTESPMPFETTDTGMLVPPTMRRAVLRALSKEPAQRPSSMREFYAELTLNERKSFPAGRASVVPHPGDRRASEVPHPPPPPPEAGSSRPSGEQKTIYDASLSRPPGGSTSSAPIPLFPRPAAVPADHGPSALHAPSSPGPSAPHAPSSPGSWAASGTPSPAVAATSHPHPAPSPAAHAQHPSQRPSHASHASHASHDLDGGRLTVPELVPPTVRDPSLSAPPPAGSSRTALWVGLVLLVLAAGAVSAYLVIRGALGEPPRPTKERSAAGVDAPPTPVDSALPPFPDTPAAPSPSASAPVGDASSPCQTAMVGALASKCDLARRSLARCPETSAHRAAAVRAVDALCRP